MKNSFKVGFLALVVAASFAACKGKSGAGSADSTKDSTKTTVVDSTVKKDTTLKADSVKADTTKKDTTKK